MLRQLRYCWDLLPPPERWQWTMTIPLAVAAALLEATGAASVYLLVRVIGDPSVLAQTPGAKYFIAWLPQDTRNLVLSLTVVVGVLYGIKNATLALLFWLTSKASSDSWAGLSQRLLRLYLMAPFSFHLRRNSAELIHNTVEVADTVFRMVVSPAVSILAEVLVITGLIAVLLLTAPGVTIIAVTLLFGLLALLARSTRQALTRWGTAEHTWRQAVLRTMAQAFEGIKEVKLRGREEFITEQFNIQQRQMIAQRHRFTALSGISRLFVETAFVVGILIVVLAITLAGPGTVDIIPVLGIYAYAGFRVIPSVNRILLNFSYIRYGLPAVARIHDDLSRHASYATTADNQPPEAPLPFVDSISIEGLTFAYEQADTTVLSDINLRIRRGESVGIVGSTGAGKSTLINLLLGLLTPGSGRICVDGTDIRMALRTWQRRIGYVPQVVYLIDDSLRRNIAFAESDAEIDEQRLLDAVRQAQLESFVKTLPKQLDTIIGERGVRLSGGERQRVAIARSLYHQPELLVFDEATSSLDPHTERELSRAIDALHGQKTLLLIAHRLTTVQGCDRIVFLQHGRIAAVGSFDELMQDNADFRQLAAAKQEREPALAQPS